MKNDARTRADRSAGRHAEQRRFIPSPAAKLARAATLALTATLSPVALPSAFTVLAQETPGETARIQGTVEAAATGAPLPGVLIRVEELDARDLTDAEGRFVLSGLPGGSFTLVAERIGMETLRREVRLDAEATVSVELMLVELAVAVPGIVVSATREAQLRQELAASVGLVDREAIRETGAAHPSEVLGSVPGVHLNVTAGEGHMTAIRQPLGTDPVYLFLEDGVPTRSTGFFNHNALYEVNLLQAEAIEVLKGPSTALYGSDAIGGVLNVRTRPPSVEPEIDWTVEGGAFGWRRVTASASDSWGRHGLRADLNLTGSDGWREGTDYDRQSGTLRWDVSLPDGASLKTVATVSRIDQQTAGASAISREDFESNPEVNYTPISFRDVRAFRLSTELSKQAGATLWSLTPYVRRNEMDMLPNWSLTFDPAIWETENSSVGVLATVRRDLPVLGARMIAGVDLDHSPGSRYERAIDPVREGSIFTDYAEGVPLYDYDVTFRQVSPYLQATFRAAERLRMETGLRADFLGYDYETRLPAVQEGDHRRPEDASVSYRHLSPKAGLTYQATDGLNLFASYRHGFRVPSESQVFRQGRAENTVDLAPVRANSFEAGLRGRLVPGVTFEATGYWMPKTDDIVAFTNPDGNRETQNAGETLHRGLELGLGADLPADLRLDLAYALARHTYEEWRPRPDLDFAGNEMEFAPRETGSAELAFAPTWLEGARLAAEWVRIGGYWMDAANSERYEGHDLLHLRASVPVYRGASLFVRVRNVTDARFAERASFAEFRGAEFAPGQPRSLFLGVRWR